MADVGNGYPQLLANRQDSMISNHTACQDAACDPCERPCEGLGTFLLTIVCCGRRSPCGKICVLWIWILVACLLTTFIIVFVVFGDQNFQVSPSDVRVATRQGATVFNSGVRFESQNDVIVSKLPAYPSDDNLLYDKPLTKEVQSNLGRQHSASAYWGFYFLKGSRISLSVCSEVPVHQYFIRGRKELNDVLNKCYAGRCPSDADAVGSCEFGPKTYAFRAIETDDYFFLYREIEWPAPPISVLRVTFHIDRRTYDLSKSIANFSCIGGFACTVPLNWQPGVAVVYTIPTYMDDFEVPLKVTYVRRVFSYCLIMGILPLVFGLLISSLLFGKCREEDDGNGDGSGQEEGQRSARRTRPSALQFTDAPPSYEALVNEGNETPPPPYPGVQNYV